jgi:hypothetical protein
MAPLRSVLHHLRRIHRPGDADVRLAPGRRQPAEAQPQVQTVAALRLPSASGYPTHIIVHGPTATASSSVSS